MKRILSQEDVQTLLSIIRTAFQNCQHTKAKSRGRPPKYPHETIILALLLKKRFKLTYRDLERQMFKVLPKGSVPDFSSIFYRFKTLDTKLLECILQQTAHKIEKVLKIKEHHAIKVEHVDANEG